MPGKCLESLKNVELVIASNHNYCINTLKLFIYTHTHTHNFENEFIFH